MRSIDERLLRAVLAGVAIAIAAPPAAAQDAEAGRQKAEVCVPCHGQNGNSVIPLFPILAGQTQRYLYLQMRDYQEKRRVDPTMYPFLAPLSREDLLNLAAFFAAQKPLAPAFKPDPARAERGKSKSQEVLCTQCHLGGFKGQNEIPRVAGQNYDYIVKQLRDFKGGKRTNDAGTMAGVSKTLSDQDIEDLAHYLVGLD